MIPAIEKTVIVPLPPKEAFRLFTKGFASWWPAEPHFESDGQDAPSMDVTVQEQEGGKIVETMPDGASSEWATITEWRPGERFAFDWYVNRDRSETTQVTVRFEPESEGTRVTLVHDGFDQLSDPGPHMAANDNTRRDGMLGNRYCGARCKMAA